MGRLSLVILIVLTTAASAQQPQTWRVQESRAPNDSVTEVTLLLGADSEIQTRGGPVRPTLMVRCTEGRTELGVYTGPYQPSATHRQSVRYRLDRSAPVVAEWNESQGYRALFHPHPRFLLFDVAIARVMLFEFTDYEGARVLVTFPTAGLREHLPRVARACGWENELPN